MKEFGPLQIKILDDYYSGISQKMVDFLNTFNPDKLIFNFRVTAGLPNKKTGILYAGIRGLGAESPYGGWENTRIGGHTMGHYLTAAAQAVARGYGECKGADGFTLLSRLSYLVEGLAECQQAVGTGFIFGATMADPKNPELQFDKLERAEYNDTWVPWYTMHKILAGLVEVHKQTAASNSLLSTKALDVAEKLGEWCWRRISAWTPEVRENVVRIEFGGMNDCLYELYKCAKAAGYAEAEHFFNAAHAFDEEWLFSHPQAIVNRHANTTIPKFVGAANRCMILLGESSGGGSPSAVPSSDALEYLLYCENFWNEVVNHHTYITGGNSECEHFGLPDILDAERSNTNCETCNTYNMLKLSRMLFMMTGKRKYADYYENTFLNAIMASVRADDAMTTYFQPMATGCFKTYCNPDVDKNFFWCCTGTGLENFTKLGDSFYFYDDETLYVNMYVSSSVRWDDKNLNLTQKSNISSGKGNTAEFTVDVDKDDEEITTEARENTLAFRLPDWLSAEPKITLNGEILYPSDSADISDGYFRITRKWESGDIISVTLPMAITAHTLQDSAGKTLGFKYGPLVLAAELGADDNMKHGVVGVQCDVSANKIVCGEEMPLSGNYGGTSNLQILPGEIIQLASGEGEAVADFAANPASHFEQLGSEPRFRLTGTSFPHEVIFSPYNTLTGQRYGIYWVFVATAQEAEFERQAAYHPDDSEVFIEGIGVGYGAQTEGNDSTYPHLQEKDSVADPHELTRYAKAGGWFSYEMAVMPGKQNFLVCTFLKADNGKGLRISVDSCEGHSGEGGTEIASVTLNYEGAAEKYTQRFAIPQQEEKKNMRITFSAPKSAPGARLCAPLKMVYQR